MITPAPGFTEKQLTWIVNLAVQSAIDRVESCIPPCVPKEDLRDPKMRKSMEAYERGALETAGMALAVLHAQITGEGLGICDAVVVYGLDKIVDTFINKRLAGEHDYWPNTEAESRKFAKMILENKGVA